MDNSLIDVRIADMKNSLASGQEQLRIHDEKKRELQATMLRISGAIQALEELKRDLAVHAQDGN
ncbi:hypothetical protein ACO0LM_01470 [Undibacterium sp. Di26W]|uniref:hypothetical protein n=1 Tax=Undibacterium sp. Di26W TaxID=3413035 RepID=UPI003BF03B91